MDKPPSKFTCKVIGQGAMLADCCRLLADRGHEVCGVVASGPVAFKFARKANIEVARDDEDYVRFLARSEFDYLFSIVHLSRIPAEALRLPKALSINFHDSLLPRYAGVHATSWALMARERYHGVTWHIMTERMDEGHVLEQAVVELGAEETASSLNMKCYRAGLESFGKLVDALALGQLNPVPQDLRRRTYFGKSARPENGGLVRWTLPAERVGAFVRGMDFGGWPNTLGTPKVLLGRRAAVLAKAVELSTTSADEPGTIVEARGRELTVSTATTDVLFREVRTLDGLRVEDVGNEYGVTAGQRVGTVDGEVASRLAYQSQIAGKHEGYWLERLRRCRTDADPGDPGGGAEMDVHDNPPAPAGERVGVDQTLWHVANVLSRSSWAAETTSDIVVWYTDSTLRDAVKGVEALFSPHVPLVLERSVGGGVGGLYEQLTRVVREAKERGTFSCDLGARFPTLRMSELLGSGALRAAKHHGGFTDRCLAFSPQPGTSVLVGDHPLACRIARVREVSCAAC